VDSIFNYAAAKQGRLARGLNLQVAATAIGVSTSTLGNWEAGRGEPTVTCFERMRKLYRVPRRSLLHTTDPDLAALPS